MFFSVSLRHLGPYMLFNVLAVRIAKKKGAILVCDEWICYEIVQAFLACSVLTLRLLPAGYK